MKNIKRIISIALFIMIFAGCLVPITSFAAEEDDSMKLMNMVFDNIGVFIVKVSSDNDAIYHTVSFLKAPDGKLVFLGPEKKDGYEYHLAVWDNDKEDIVDVKYSVAKDLGGGDVIYKVDDSIKVEGLTYADEKEIDSIKADDALHIASLYGNDDNPGNFTLFYCYVESNSDDHIKLEKDFAGWYQGCNWTAVFNKDGKVVGYTSGLGPMIVRKVDGVSEYILGKDSKDTNSNPEADYPPHEIGTTGNKEVKKEDKNVKAYFIALGIIVVVVAAAFAVIVLLKKKKGTNFEAGNSDVHFSPDVAPNYDMGQTENPDENETVLGETQDHVGDTEIEEYDERPEFFFTETEDDEIENEPSEETEALEETAPIGETVAIGETINVGETVALESEEEKDVRPVYPIRIFGSGGYFDRQMIQRDKEIIIGRDPKVCNCLYPLEEEGISAVHCKIVSYGEYAELTDSNSTYGTFLNGERILSGFPYRLRHGETFYLADIRNSFIYE